MQRFQSTRPLRGATAKLQPAYQTLDISIHAPLAGRDAAIRERCAPCGISIHAPLAGRDVASIIFLTPLSISIHAPLAGRDMENGLGDINITHFNPRAPCGARRAYLGREITFFRFQSTRPLRGATREAARRLLDLQISIHAPLAGRDAIRAGSPSASSTISIHAPLAGRDVTGRLPQLRVQHFNPRAPCGARHEMWA